MSICENHNKRAKIFPLTVENVSRKDARLSVTYTYMAEKIVIKCAKKKQSELLVLMYLTMCVSVCAKYILGRIHFAHSAKCIRVTFKLKDTHYLTPRFKS